MAENRDVVRPLKSSGGVSGKRKPEILTLSVWLLWVLSVLSLFAKLLVEGPWRVGGVVSVDGLTVLMWVVVTFFSGIVHSYSVRYMQGSRYVDRFFNHLFGFTLTIMVLVAANHVVLFGFSWLVMGLIMSGLIGCVDGWSQAREAARLSRRYFVVSSLFVGTALGVMWWKTGSSTVSGILDSLGTVPQPFVLISIGALVLAAMVQSALFPFHTWLLSSMTAPTPASALMHAGFVNAGGILLTRFAPLLVDNPRSMLAVLVLGGVSAVLGKLMKSVQSDIKRKLGCSTVGQMGFMILQAGLGFFNAAITHLILHGFYKAYLFLSSGERVSHESPDERDGRSVGVLGALTTLLTAVAGGALFALLTGKGTGFDSGLLLTLLVVVTTFHGSRNAVRYRSVPSPVRFGAVPVLFLVSISVYALIFRGVSLVLSDVPVIEAPTEVTPVHAVVAVAFVVGYVAVEFDVQRRSKRLYTGLLNLSSPSPKTVLTDKEDYDAR